MGKSFMVRDAQAVFLNVQEQTHIPGFEKNKPKFRGMFIIPPKHPAVKMFQDSIVELLKDKARAEYQRYFNKEPNSKELYDHALKMYDCMENKFCGIVQARDDGKYSDQEGMFYFKATSAKVALYIPEPVPDEPGRTRYVKIPNPGSEDWFYPGGIYSVKVDVNYFATNGTLFAYFNGIYWRAKGNPRSYATADEEEAPMLEDALDDGAAEQLDDDEPAF